LQSLRFVTRSGRFHNGLFLLAKSDINDSFDGGCGQVSDLLARKVLIGTAPENVRNAAAVVAEMMRPMLAGL
jgi:hypothetical protein